MSGSRGKFDPRSYMKKKSLQIPNQNEGTKLTRSTPAGLQRVALCLRMDSRRTITTILTFLLAAPFLSVFGAQIPPASAQAPGASLTGRIIDQGVDTDGNGLFEHLEIGVEVNVTEPGLFSIDAGGLRDSHHNYIDVWDHTETYLNAGLVHLNLSLAGVKIYICGFNPSHVMSIELRDKEWRTIGSLNDIPLSREYSYSEFETPKASLIGVIYDEGVDTDEDGTYDYLEIGVEVNVSEAGDYMVEVQGLLDTNYGYITVGDSQSAVLDVGVQVVHLSLAGPTIYASGLNPTMVSYISLYDEYHELFGKLHETPLSRTYFCNEFDVPVPLTVGVEVGDWAKYSLAVTWQPTDPSATEPSDIEELKRTEWMEVEVQSVSNTYITIVGTYLFKDGTNKTFASMSADLAEQFLTFLIPSNLSKGDLIPGIGSIDDTALRTYAGASRNVNYINSSTYFSGTATMRSWGAMYWDKPTGILCELLMETSTPTDFRSILLNMTETSLWEKIRTALSCSFSKDTITQGGSIAVSGSMNATLSGKTITLTYEMPDGSTLTRTVTTGSDGSYSDSYAPYAIGSWSVTASWEGDSTHFGATSSSKSFIVGPEPFIETPTGIAAIAGGIAAILIAAVFMLKKRKI